MQSTTLYPLLDGNLEVTYYFNDNRFKGSYMQPADDLDYEIESIKAEDSNIELLDIISHATLKSIEEFICDEIFEAGY